MRNGLRQFHDFVPVLLAGLVALAAWPSAASASTAAATSAPPRYVDVSSYLRTDAAYEAWYVLRSGLVRNFDDICGDTFCEGDYSNIQSLRFLCSVHAVSGRIGTCSWTFAASDDAIDSRNGAITARTVHWQCRTPLVVGTTVEQLLAALQGDRPLYAPLPNSDRTIYDGLADCL